MKTELWNFLNSKYISNLYIRRIRTHEQDEFIYLISKDFTRFIKNISIITGEPIELVNDPLLKQKIRRQHEFASKKVYEFIGSLADYFDLIEPNRNDLFSSNASFYKDYDSQPFSALLNDFKEQKSQKEIGNTSINKINNDQNKTNNTSLCIREEQIYFNTSSNTDKSLSQIMVQVRYFLIKFLERKREIFKR